MYCNIVWGNTFKSYLTKLEVMQKKIVRIITCSPYRSHTKELYMKYGLLNMDGIHKYVSAIFMFKLCHDEVPSLFASMFTGNTEVHSHSTRQSAHFHLPKCNTILLQSNIRYYGAVLWNSIPSEIKELHTVNSFKYNYKRYLLQH